MSGKRNLKIDELRGMLMILVVVGHIIQYVMCPDTFDYNIFFRIIYSFHMPLFMCLSGYVNQMVHPDINVEQLIKRIISLVTPFLIWGIFSSLKNGIQYYEIILYPEKGLWFLWVLAVINVAVYIAYLLEKKVGPAAYILINLLLLIIPVSLFGIGLVKIYYTWYVLGFVVPKFWSKFKWKKWIKWTGIFGWPITAAFWVRGAEPLFAHNFNFTGILGKGFAVFCSVYRIYLVPVLGIIFAWTIWGGYGVASGVNG